VFLAVAFDGHLEAQQVRLPGDRRRIRPFGVISVLNLLRLRLIGSDREAVMR
jgi:nicotinamide-nucleotide amidase